MPLEPSRRAAVLASAAEDLARGADRRILAEELAYAYDLSDEEAMALLVEARPRPVKTPTTPGQWLGRIMLLGLMVLTNSGLLYRVFPAWDLWIVCALAVVTYVLVIGPAGRARLSRPAARLRRRPSAGRPSRA